MTGATQTSLSWTATIGLDAPYFTPAPGSAVGYVGVTATALDGSSALLVPLDVAMP